MKGRPRRLGSVSHAVICEPQDVAGLCTMVLGIAPRSIEMGRDVQTSWIDWQIKLHRSSYCLPCTTNHCCPLSKLANCGPWESALSKADLTGKVRPGLLSDPATVAPAGATLDHFSICRQRLWVPESVPSQTHGFHVLDKLGLITTDNLGCAVLAVLRSAEITRPDKPLSVRETLSQLTYGTIVVSTSFTGDAVIYMHGKHAA